MEVFASISTFRLRDFTFFFFFYYSIGRVITVVEKTLSHPTIKLVRDRVFKRICYVQGASDSVHSEKNFSSPSNSCMTARNPLVKNSCSIRRDFLKSISNTAVRA